MTGSRKLRILWVDEQLAGIQHFIDLLEFEGHSVQVVEDATTALRTLQGRPAEFDLAIIDVMLPPGEDRVLFPNGETDEGASTGVLLVTYLIEGKRGQFEGVAGIDRRILIFSGAGVERITKKIRAAVKKWNLQYLQKRLNNDPILVHTHINEYFGREQ